MVIPGHNLGNSQVSVNRTIDPTMVFSLPRYKMEILAGVIIFVFFFFTKNKAIRRSNSKANKRDFWNSSRK